MAASGEDDVKMLSVEQAAAVLGVSPASVIRMADRGELAFLQNGERRYFQLKWLAEWAARPDNEPTADELVQATQDLELAEHLRDYARRRDNALRRGARTLADIPPPASKPPTGEDGVDRGILGRDGDDGIFEGKR